MEKSQERESNPMKDPPNHKSHQFVEDEEDEINDSLRTFEESTLLELLSTRFFYFKPMTRIWQKMVTKESR